LDFYNKIYKKEHINNINSYLKYQKVKNID